MKTLDPKQLAAFASVIEHGTFKAAAQSLNLTLPAVSLRLKSLEDELGRRLLIRGKNARPTPAGRMLMNYVQKSRLLEGEFFETLSGKSVWQSLEVAVNADSLASWFLPAVGPSLERMKLLLNLHVDDQDHTLALLKSGEVAGCVTTQSKAVAGCIAEPLGVMRYRCVASPQLRDQLRLGLSARQALGIHQLLCHPAVCFNRKDALQDQFLKLRFGVDTPQYPRHYVPAADAFHKALISGLGWGMEATIQHPNDYKVKNVVDLFPGFTVDLALFWQHWARESVHAARLTDVVKKAARKCLL